MNEIIITAINKHKEALSFLESRQDKIEDIASLFVSSLKNKGKIIFMGNGGSAADSQHLAAELVGRFKQNREALRGLALSTNTSIITAIGNDFDFEDIFVRQVEALANPPDVIVGISTSGDSKNVIKAVKKSKELKLKTVGFLGRNGGELSKLVDVSLLIPSNDTPAIQEMHILAGHIICGIVEKHFYDGK